MKRENYSDQGDSSILQSEEVDSVSNEISHDPGNEYWSAEENDRFQSIRQASAWGDAERMLYDWLEKTPEPTRRIQVARWARIAFWERLKTMGPLNEPIFRASYADLKEQMDRLITSGWAEIERQNAEAVDEEAATASKKVHVVSDFSQVVRIFDGMKRAGIISKKTTVRQLVELCFVDGSTAKSLEANYNGTMKHVRRGSKVRSDEMLEFLKILGAQLSSDDRNRLVDYLLRVED